MDYLDSFGLYQNKLKQLESLYYNVQECRTMLDNKITKGLSDVMIAVENYPDLKANENFLHLQRTLVELEEQISAGRRAFNASVTDYNNAVEMFPTNILASMINYKRKSFFEISAEQRENIDAGKHLRS